MIACHIAFYLFPQCLPAGVSKHVFSVAPYKNSFIITYSSKRKFHENMYREDLLNDLIMLLSWTICMVNCGFIKTLSSDKLDSHAQLMDSKCREACSSKAMTHKTSWGRMGSPQWNQTLLWLRSNGWFNLFASRIFSGSATDPLCGVWGCGWTTIHPIYLRVGSFQAQQLILFAVFGAVDERLVSFILV